MASDEELVGRVAVGDESALEELVGRYAVSLSRFIERQTAGNDVEDLYQETWIRAIGAIDSFDRVRRFSTWLFTIAVNLCRDWHRRRASRPAGGEDSERIGYKSDASARLDAQALLAHLPFEQREAVILRYYHDLSENEMSRVMGVPTGTVKSRLHAALKTMTRLAREDGATA